MKNVLLKPYLKIITHYHTYIQMARRLNEEFISILGELNDLMTLQGEPFRARAYGKAQETVMTYNGDITSVEQLKDKSGIGSTIMNKLTEYVETGTLKVLERERQNPINILSKIYGIGPKKAKELVDEGITSIEALRKVQDKKLNAKQKLGLKYFEDIEKRIPRNEIDEYKNKLNDVFAKCTPSGSTFEIVGSYRRGATDSGDIDIIITNSKNDANSFTNFVDALIKNKMIVEVLSRGQSKSMTIMQLASTNPFRRVDFMYSPPDEYSFSILYFTGSKIFNTVQRQRALDMKYTLNEHGIYHMVDGKKGNKVEGSFPNEKSIFDLLGMMFKEPQERKDGRAVQFTEQEQAQQTQAQQAQVQQTQAQPIETITMPTEPTITIKKPKNVTLKKKIKQNPVTTLLNFKSSGLSALKLMTEAELSSLIRDANNAYYHNSQPIMTDNEYDILIEYTKSHYPDNEAVKEGHTKPLNTDGETVEKNKVKLPYEMWSMDKIKPDTDTLSKWAKKYKGPYVVSCKVDGVSGLYTTEGSEPKLYTRGDGITGQDVSHIIPYLKLPTIKNITIRGEFIIAKDLFSTKYASKFANPRNFVAGTINHKTIDEEKYKDLSFIIYEVIEPAIKPSEQMKYFDKLNSSIDIVKYASMSTITNEILSELLIQWRSEYKYEIDGIICMNDDIYPRPKGNPEYAFAFKMVLSDQVAEAKVVDVIWTPSKDGYLKPRVQIEPITLGGVNIEYATGFNAKFIEDNRIGVGSLIRLIRSGDVIPHIVETIQAASSPLFPLEPYEWNETHVDIILKNKADNQVVKEKNITGFFTNLGVEGLSSGNVKRIVEAGFDTIAKIIAMTEADFLKVDGFKQKMATKISDGIKTKVEGSSLPELMHATNIFGRGFGTKKLELILTELPTILVSSTNISTTNTNKSDKIKMISKVQGMAKKTAEQFVDKIELFIEFMNESKLTDKLIYVPKHEQHNIVINETHPLYKKKYVMTGFRDKDLMDKLSALGAEQASSVSKNTFVVIVKNLDEDTGKVDDAKKLNIPIMTHQMIIEKYL